MTDEISVFRPTHERKLLFCGKEIATADLKDGKDYVSVRSLCEAFGLNAGAQRKRLMRQQVTRKKAVAGPKARLTPEQPGQLRERIASLGSLLQESGVAKPYPGIYMDITRLDIRQEDFRTVVEFMEGQVRTLARSTLTRRSPPAAQES